MVKFSDEIEGKEQEDKLIKKVKKLKEKLNKGKAKRLVIKSKYKALLSSNEKSINRSCVSIGNNETRIQKINRIKEEIKETIGNNADILYLIISEELAKEHKSTQDHLKKLDISIEKLTKINYSLKEMLLSREEAISNLKKDKDIYRYTKNKFLIEFKQASMEKFNNSKLEWAQLDPQYLINHVQILAAIPLGIGLINTEMVLDLIKKRKISDIYSWKSTKSWILTPKMISFIKAKETSHITADSYCKDWNATFKDIFNNPAISLEQCQFKWGTFIKFMNTEREYINLEWFPGYPWFIRVITLFEFSHIKRDSFIQKLRDNKINFKAKFEGALTIIEIKNELSDPNIFKKISKKYEIVDGNIENATNLWNSIKSLKLGH